MNGSTTAKPTTATGADPAKQPAFVTTQWSVVLTAGRSDTTRAQDALEKLCRVYWYPLYVYVRRRGHSPEDAKDLTQQFFARLLKNKSLANANPNRGRFRSFLLGAMNHCLADERARWRAKKRGEGQVTIPLDFAMAERQFELGAADDASPDKIFDRRWAAALLNEVLNRLEGEYRSDGKAELFDGLKQTLVGTRESQPYRLLAEKLAMNEGAARTAVHRLRRRYRELIREEIANTVSSPEEVEQELRHLFTMSG